MKNKLLKNIKQIHGHKSSSEQHRCIYIESGTIHTIAPFDEILKEFGAEVLDKIETIDCSDCIAIPGFVDSHTHLLFAGTRENELFMRAAGKPYLDILKAGGGIYNTVEAVRSASEEELIQNGLKYLDKALSFGTTTIEIKSGYGLDYANEKKMLRVIDRLHELHPVDIVPTFLVHTVPKETNRKAYIDDVAQRMIPEFREYTEWFDIFLEEGVFDFKEAEFLIGKAIDAGYYIGIHTNQVHDIGGIELADRLGVRHVNHLEVLSDKDARRIIDNKDMYAVFLPAAEAFVFSEHVGQIHKLLNIPDRIVLSTDFNPGSSPVIDPLFVITQAVLRYRISDPGLLIDAFTKNPADMLYLPDCGRIEEVKKADIVLYDSESIEQIPYLGTHRPIKHIIKNGRRIKP